MKMYNKIFPKCEGCTHFCEILYVLDVIENTVGRIQKEDTTVYLLIRRRISESGRRIYAPDSDLHRRILGCNSRPAARWRFHIFYASDMQMSIYADSETNDRPALFFFYVVCVQLFPAESYPCYSRGKCGESYVKYGHRSRTEF